MACRTASLRRARSGKGAPAEWKVLDDPTVSSGRVLGQVSSDRTDYRFPLVIYQSVSAANLEVTVPFNGRLGSGGPGGRHRRASVRPGARRIGFLGVTFKSGTDDLRESPQVELIGRLFGSDAEVRLHDRNVTPAGVALARAHSNAASMRTRAALDAIPSLLIPSAGDSGGLGGYGRGRP